MGFRGLLLIACALAAGCTQSNSVVCGNLICSEAAVCSPSGDTCVLPTQLDACRGKSDDTPCTFPGVTMGACVSGVCTEVICGNKHVDTITGEVCDDGNRISGDGCSADCKSKEICGDGILDVVAGEECDCGMGTPAEGCVHPNNNTPGAECRPGCKRSRCGDGIVDPSEVCDDGNIDPGDGCRADCQGRWTQLATNTFTTLTDVFALSETDAYAVGETGHFLKWNGTHWQVLPGPPTTGTLTHVWAASASAVYVLEANSSMIWHFNGANSWTPIDPRGSGSGNPVWSGIWGTGVDDVWLVGSESTNGRFSHLSGGNWTMFNQTVLNNIVLQDVYASPSSTSAYATDTAGNVYTLTTTTPYLSAALGGNARGMFLSGTSSTDVVAWGRQTALGGKLYNGSTWTPLFGSEELPTLSDVTATRNGTMLQQIAVGGQGNTMVCDGTSCTGWTFTTAAILTGVCAYGYNRAFIVGTNGTILY